MSESVDLVQAPHAKILIAIATYNEIENLPGLVETIFRTVPRVDILVVDDHSPDGTGRWVLEASQSQARLHAMIRTDQRGLGTAVMAALKYAIEHDYDYVVNMDADFSHPVEAINKMIECCQEFHHDVVIGSRYVSGGRIVGWSLKRRFMSWGINTFARWAFGLPTRDNSGAFRCYSVEMLRKIDFDKIVSRGYSFFEEVLYRLKQLNARMYEVPITFTDRTKGKSKINKKEAFTALWILTTFGLGFRK